MFTVKNEWIIAFIVFCLLLQAAGKSSRVKYRHLRGLRLSSLWQVRARLMRWQDQRQTFVWGRFRLPLALASQHFLVAGTTGSGKTLILRLLMQSVFPRIGLGEGHRALVYDGKGDLLDVLRGMMHKLLTVFTFDPFSPEGVRWNIAVDVTDAASANLVARILFPKQSGENQPFFTESVQNLAASIMEVLIERAAGQWRLSHLIFILRSPERIKSTLALTEKGRDTLSQFIHSGETWGNITAVISNRIRSYEIVSALWDHADHAVSLKEWNETESILVLKKNQDCSEVVDAINRVLFALAKRRLLSTPETPNRRTWVILDELASFGGKEAARELTLLMEQGRNRNISVALGFQNISSLRDQLGNHGADRLIALCSTKALLRCEDHLSAEWSAGFFGKQEVQVESISTTRGGGGGGSYHSSTSTSYQDKERWTVMPSEFLSIPRAGNDHGVTGYFLVPDGDPPLAFRDTLPAKWLFGRHTLAPVPEPNKDQRPSSQQNSTVTEAELAQLLQGGAPSSPAMSAQAGPSAAGMPVPPPSTGTGGTVAATGATPVPQNAPNPVAVRTPTTPQTSAPASAPAPGGAQATPPASSASGTPVPTSSVVPPAASSSHSTPPVAAGAQPQPQPQSHQQSPPPPAPQAATPGAPTIALQPNVQTMAAVNVSMTAPITLTVSPPPAPAPAPPAAVTPAAAPVPKANAQTAATSSQSQSTPRRRNKVASVAAAGGPKVSPAPTKAPSASPGGSSQPSPVAPPSPQVASIWTVKRTI